MVSDVLSDAVFHIKEYLEDEELNWYREADGSVWEPLRECLAKMESVRIILDTPPSSMRGG